MVVNPALFSSNKQTYETPNWLFQVASRLYGPFDLDAAATRSNTKCARYFTELDDSLSQDWIADKVWINPPYGRTTTGKFVRKAYNEVWECHCNRVVMLLPARTDTKWFHTYCTQGTIVFIKGRLKFENAKNNAPFPSMLVIFDIDTLGVRPPDGFCRMSTDTLEGWHM